MSRFFVNRVRDL